MPIYIVDIGSPMAGRTVEIDAISPKEAMDIVKNMLDEIKMEKVIQIRDDQNRFFYDCNNGFYNDR